MDKPSRNTARARRRFASSLPRDVAAGLRFTPSAWADCVWWQTQDRKTLRTINTLIGSALRAPFEGLGKPEPLIGDFAGFWSRRIDEKSRLVYAAEGKEGARAITVISCRFHYDDNL